MEFKNNIKEIFKSWYSMFIFSVTQLYFALSRSWSKENDKYKDLVRIDSYRDVLQCILCIVLSIGTVVLTYLVIESQFFLTLVATICVIVLQYFTFYRKKIKDNKNEPN